MNVNAAANSVTLELCLRHYFYNTVFKIKHKLYIALVSTHAMKKSGCATKSSGGSISGTFRVHPSHYRFLEYDFPARAYLLRVTACTCSQP
jgi:hypothetical protein